MSTNVNFGFGFGTKVKKAVKKNAQGKRRIRRTLIVGSLVGRLPEGG